jgi:hypothetical protein
MDEQRHELRYPAARPYVAACSAPDHLVILEELRIYR